MGPRKTNKNLHQSTERIGTEQKLGQFWTLAGKKAPVLMGVNSQ